MDSRNRFDGYRVQVHLANQAIEVFTRRGYDWMHRFRKIAADALRIGAGGAVIDGEVVAPAADGTTDFSGLQNEWRATPDPTLHRPATPMILIRSTSRSSIAMAMLAGRKATSSELFQFLPNFPYSACPAKLDLGAWKVV